MQAAGGKVCGWERKKCNAVTGHIHPLLVLRGFAVAPRDFAFGFFASFRDPCAIFPRQVCLQVCLAGLSRRGSTSVALGENRMSYARYFQLKIFVYGLFGGARQGGYHHPAVMEKQ